MRLMLDMQVLLWWLADSPHLRQAARSLIADGNNTLYVSAASAWEIEIQRALGKLRAPHNLEETLARERSLELPVQITHTTKLRTLPPVHRHPFDRWLVTQAPQLPQEAACGPPLPSRSIIARGSNGYPPVFLLLAELVGSRGCGWFLRVVSR